MTNHGFLLAGVLTGFSIAVPIGPMGLLCIQRTLASGMRTGITTGLGAVTVNVAYGAIILLGMNGLAPWIATGGRALNAAGGLFLLWSAARTLMRNPAKAQPQALKLDGLAAYGSAVAFNAVNPMSMILIVTLLTPIVGGSALPPVDAGLLLLGMFGAAMCWWVCLSGGVALLRAGLTPAVLVNVNRGAGLLLTVYGSLVLARSVQM